MPDVDRGEERETEPISTDTEVVERFRDGDRDALATLYERHAAQLRQAVSGILSAADADDVVQATFVRAWERRSTLRDPAAFGAWLVAMGRNLALDVRRRQRNAPFQSDPIDDGAAVGDGEAPEASSLSRDQAELVDAAVGGLEERQRRVIRLVVAGASTGELAGALDVSRGHAAVLSFRGRHALRNAVRTLLLVRSGRGCDRLRVLVPDRAATLTPTVRRTIDRHMRRCRICRGVADGLASPEELLALLPAVAAGHGAGGAAAGSHGGAAGSAAAAHGGAAVSAGAPGLGGGLAAAAAAVVVLAGALGYVGWRHQGEHAGAPAPPVRTGRFIAIGGDPDAHARLGPNRLGAQHVLAVAVRWVVAGRASPRVLLVSGSHDPGGGRVDPRQGLTDAGLHVDAAAAEPRAGFLDLHTVDLHAYDAVVVASDFGGWLGQAELEVLDGRRADIAAFLRAGGGLVALTEGGAVPAGVAPTTTAGRLAFLPVALVSTPTSQAIGRAIVTPDGAAAGLDPGDDATNYLHSTLTAPAGTVVLERDPAGRPLIVGGSAPA